MIAHRGVSGLETENTCAAFVAAGNRSYFGVETDVRQTSDGKFVLLHDDNTSRVSGENYTVEKSDLSQLQSVRFYNFPDRTVRCDLMIPQLSDYLSICRQYGKAAIIELKEKFTPSQIRQIAGEAERFNMLPDVIFISFIWENLEILRGIYPQQPAQFLTADPCDDEMTEKLAASGIDIDIENGRVTKELVNKMHDRGRLVNCWTCDNPDRAAYLVECGVDFITTNILE